MYFESSKLAFLVSAVQAQREGEVQLAEDLLLAPHVLHLVLARDRLLLHPLHREVVLLVPLEPHQDHPSVRPQSQRPHLREVRRAHLVLLHPQSALRVQLQVHLVVPRQRRLLGERHPRGALCHLALLLLAQESHSGLQALFKLLLHKIEAAVQTVDLMYNNTLVVAFAILVCN
jgi:hypothetical protein